MKSTIPYVTRGFQHHWSSLVIYTTFPCLLASAKAFAAYQFAMYGMGNVPEEQLEAFAKNILSQEEQGRRILDKVEDDKTFDAVREVVTLKKKKISVEKFRELK